VRFIWGREDARAPAYQAVFPIFWLRITGAAALFRAEETGGEQ
jgi:hypothetical protein